MNEPLAVACSTASDLVRFALATKAESVDGELAQSVIADDAPATTGSSLPWLSNVAHTNTAALALQVADVFAEQK